MRILLKILITTGALLGSLTPVLSYAADGNSGTESTGSSTVTVTIPELVKITSVGNLSQTYNGTTAFDQNDNVCIYSNMDTGGAGTYTVLATGAYNDGAAQAGFKVGRGAGGGTQTVDYTVEWNDTNSTGGAAITHNSASTGHTGWSNSTNCSGGTNANFRVQMTNADLLAVRPGTYTSTLTFVITPVP